MILVKKAVMTGKVRAGVLKLGIKRKKDVKDIEVVYIFHPRQMCGREKSIKKGNYGKYNKLLLKKLKKVIMLFIVKGDFT